MGVRARTCTCYSFSGEAGAFPRWEAGQRKEGAVRKKIKQIQGDTLVTKLSQPHKKLLAVIRTRLHRTLRGSEQSPTALTPLGWDSPVGPKSPALLDCISQPLHGAPGEASAHPGHRALSASWHGERSQGFCATGWSVLDADSLGSNVAGVMEVEL